MLCVVFYMVCVYVLCVCLVFSFVCGNGVFDQV